MKRRVPGDAIPVRLEHRTRLGVDVRILEVGLGERFGDGSIELRVGLDVDRRAAIVALQVQDVHAGELADLGDQVRIPVVLRVELEPQLGMLGQALLKRLGVRGAGVVAEAPQARGADEAHGARLAPDSFEERDSVLAQRQVERRALVGPAAVVARGVADRGRVGEEVEPAEELAELPESGWAAQVVDGPRVPVGDVVEHVVDDVLSEALLAVPSETDHGRGPREVTVGAVVLLELVGLHLDRELGEFLVGAHCVVRLSTRSINLSLSRERKVLFGVSWTEQG